MYEVYAQILVVEENLDEVHNRWDKWRYQFGGRDQGVEGKREVMTISGYVIGEIESFRYLGSFVQRDG